MSTTIAGLGPIMQLAFVPRDVDAAVAFWTKVMGAGPFFRLSHVQTRETRYRGAAAAIDFSMMLGYWGDMQIELIEQHCSTPSIYSRWHAEGRDGLHHVCLTVDDIAEARRVCAEAGARVEQEVFLDSGEAIYVDTGGGPGTMVEILQPIPGFAELCAMMRDAHRTWDGSDPVRALG